MRTIQWICRFFLFWGIPIGIVFFLGPFSYAGQDRAQSVDKLECPRDMKVLLKNYREAYERLLAVMGTGEGGKMDTPQKRQAYAVYKFYKNCYMISGRVSADTEPVSGSPLRTCSSSLSRHIVSIDLSVGEKIPYESLKRVEISIRNSEGAEFFRAMINRSSQCAPVPPSAFGVYPVGEKETPKLKDVKSAGQQARIPVKSKYSHLVSGCGTSWGRGVLFIHWQIRPVKWPCPDGRGYVFVKIVPMNGRQTSWIKCGSFTYAGQGRSHRKGVELQEEMVRP